jgi:hypothetical protein
MVLICCFLVVLREQVAYGRDFGKESLLAFNGVVIENAVAAS